MLSPRSFGAWPIRLLAHRNWHPPFGGGTHTAVPLTDRVPAPKDYVIVADEAIADNCADQVKYVWVVDVRDKRIRSRSRRFPRQPSRNIARWAATLDRTTSMKTAGGSRLLRAVRRHRHLG